jgi:hypothetical protein
VCSSDLQQAEQILTQAKANKLSATAAAIAAGGEPPPSPYPPIIAGYFASEMPDPILAAHFDAMLGELAEKKANKAAGSKGKAGGPPPSSSSSASKGKGSVRLGSRRSSSINATSMKELISGPNARFNLSWRLGVPLALRDAESEKAIEEALDAAAAVTGVAIKPASSSLSDMQAKAKGKGKGKGTGQQEEEEPRYKFKTPALERLEVGGRHSVSPVAMTAVYQEALRCADALKLPCFRVASGHILCRIGRRGPGAANPAAAAAGGGAAAAAAAAAAAGAAAGGGGGAVPERRMASTAA